MTSNIYRNGCKSIANKLEDIGGTHGRGDSSVYEVKTVLWLQHDLLDFLGSRSGTRLCLFRDFLGRHCD